VKKRSKDNYASGHRTDDIARGPTIMFKVSFQ
jgi:hypothetical protein